MGDWIVLLIILALEYGPRLFFEQVMARHDAPRTDLKLAGREVARRILDRAGLKDITLETLPDEGTGYSDHYDEKAHVIRLSPAIADGHSIAAYAVAAHEAGHAIQFAEKEGWLVWDERIGHLFGYLQYGLFAAMAVFIVIGIGSELSDETRRYLGWVLYGVLGCSLVLRFVTLPTELDANFGRALPLLQSGRYLGTDDLGAASVVLTAAALTYAAFAALGLVTLGVFAFSVAR